MQVRSFLYLHHYAALASSCTVYAHLIKLCFSTFIFLTGFKSAVVKPLLKKATLDYEVFLNFRPILNLTFFSKLIEM